LNKDLGVRNMEKRRIIPILLYIVILPNMEVESFSFPQDWMKIRQMMEERRIKEQQEEDLGMRFGGAVRFEDEYTDDSYLNRPWRTTTTTTPPPLPPIVLDPIMEEMMSTVNWTEIEIRFGGGLGLDDGLSVRGAFGDYEEVETVPAGYRASDSIWQFTMSMIKSGLKDGSTGNSLFSPISILTTINMLLLGTQGRTQTEIQDALGYPRYTSQVHQQFQQVIKSMNEDIGVTVATSNALFTQVNFPIKDTYKNELRRLYGDKVDVVPMDFAFRPRTTLRRMNRFIAQNTNNMIEEMFTQPVSPGTKVVVSNCLYFNGSWEYEFLFEPGIDEGRNDSFHSFSGDRQVTYMSAKLDFPYYKDEDLGMEILSLPYEHDVRNEEISEAHMFLIRPIEDGQEAYETLESKFTSLHFQDVFQKMEPAYAEIELPRMKMEFQANLKDYLADIGIHSLFSGNASRDFLPLTEQWQDFVLDTLQHKAVLKITEKGTEAAAATMAVQFYLGPMFTITFDKPFFLFIYDALNKAVIFWGRVVEPNPIFVPMSDPVDYY